VNRVQCADLLSVRASVGVCRPRSPRSRARVYSAPACPATDPGIGPVSPEIRLHADALCTPAEASARPRFCPVTPVMLFSSSASVSPPPPPCPGTLHHTRTNQPTNQPQAIQSLVYLFCSWTGLVQRHANDTQTSQIQSSTLHKLTCNCHKVRHNTDDRDYVKLLRQSGRTDLRDLLIDFTLH